MGISLINNSTGLILNELDKSSKEVKKNFARLSSGKRINTAADDAAGLAIASQLSTETRTLGQASRNISDAISQLNIADGALNSASTITTRLAELSTQAANGTLSDSQRQSLNQEFQSLKGELDRISSSTTFNSNNVFGSTTTIQSGTDGSTDSQTQVEIDSINSASLGLASLDISTQAGARAALDATQNANSTIAQSRGEIGAVESRLSTVYDNLKTQQVNKEEARSRIEDADVAETSSNLLAAKIKQKTGVAAYAQAKLEPKLALKLIS